MQELKTAHGGGAQSAGTILMSLYQQMHGRMTKAAMPLWVASGLVKPQRHREERDGPVPDEARRRGRDELFEQNPFLWVQQYLRPAVERLAKAQHISPETADQRHVLEPERRVRRLQHVLQGRRSTSATRSRSAGPTAATAAYQKLLKTDPTLAGPGAARRSGRTCWRRSASRSCRSWSPAP
jgi:hypothetical protein